MKKSILLLIAIISFSGYAQDFTFGKVSKAELEEEIHPIVSDAAAAYLFKSRKTYFDSDVYKGFYLVNEHRERIKIYNGKGVKYARKVIPYYYGTLVLEPLAYNKNGKYARVKDKVVDIEAYTYNLENGEVKKIELSKDRIKRKKHNLKNFRAKVIAMDDVKPGSVIEIRYKTISILDYQMKDIQMKFDIPVNRLEYDVISPEYFKKNLNYLSEYKPNQIKKERIVKDFYVLSPQFISSNIGDSGFLMRDPSDLRNNHARIQLEYERETKKYVKSNKGIKE